MKTNLKLNPALTDLSWMARLGHQTLRSPAGIHARWRFARSALAVAYLVPKHFRRTMREQTAFHILRCGVRQLPMIGVVGLVLGLLVVGQAVSLLSEVSAQGFMGKIMVTVVMRELGPLLTAFLLAAPGLGTMTVVELGALRLGPEAEKGPVVGVQLMRELVAPRLRAFTVFSFLFDDLFDFYRAGQRLHRRFSAECAPPPLAVRLLLQPAGRIDAHWMDFLLVAVKAILFGAVIALVSCYHGIEQLSNIERISIRNDACGGGKPGALPVCRRVISGGVYHSMKESQPVSDPHSQKTGTHRGGFCFGRCPVAGGRFRLLPEQSRRAQRLARAAGALFWTRGLKQRRGPEGKAT